MSSEYKNNPAPRKLRDHLVETLIHETQINRFYFLALLGATVIATLGLLVNSTAVVIGAMLIAPLSWPIIGMATGTVTTRGHLLGRSLKLTGYSVVLTLLTAYLVTLITPLAGITPEIELRTSPTLLDLMIALASSAVGILALYWPQITGSLAGVAVSIALLPPLCVAGIGLALGSWAIFSGAFLLFGANAGAMVFSGIVLLYLLGYRPHRQEEKHNWHLGIVFSTVFLILISIPLGLLLRQTIEQTNLSRAIEYTLHQDIDDILPGGTINDIRIRFPGDQKEPVRIDASVYLVEGAYINLGQKNQLGERLNSLTERPLDFQLTVIRSLSVRPEEDTERSRLLREIEQAVEQEMLAISEELVIEQLRIDLDSIDAETVELYLLVRQPEGVLFDFDQKQALAQRLSEKLSMEIQMEIELIPVVQVLAETDNTRLRRQVRTAVIAELANLSDTFFLDELSITTEESDSRITELNLVANVRIPEGQQISFEDKERIRSALIQTLEIEEITLEIYLVPFQRVVEEEEVEDEVAVEAEESSSNDSSNPIDNEN